jgi:hypothetical protein
MEIPSGPVVREHQMQQESTATATQPEDGWLEPIVTVGPRRTVVAKEGFTPPTGDPPPPPPPWSTSSQRRPTKPTDQNQHKNKTGHKPKNNPIIAENKNTLSKDDVGQEGYQNRKKSKGKDNTQTNEEPTNEDNKQTNDKQTPEQPLPNWMQFSAQYLVYLVHILVWIGIVGSGFVYVVRVCMSELTKIKKNDDPSTPTDANTNPPPVPLFDIPQYSVKGQLPVKERGPVQVPGQDKPPTWVDKWMHITVDKGRLYGGQESTKYWNNIFHGISNNESDNEGESEMSLFAYYMSKVYPKLFTFTHNTVHHGIYKYVGEHVSNAGLLMCLSHVCIMIATTVNVIGSCCMSIWYHMSEFQTLFKILDNTAPKPTQANWENASPDAGYQSVTRWLMVIFVYSFGAMLSAMAAPFVTWWASVHSLLSVTYEFPNEHDHSKTKHPWYHYIWTNLIYHQHLLTFLSMVAIIPTANQWLGPMYGLMAGIAVVSTIWFTDPFTTLVSAYASPINTTITNSVSGVSNNVTVDRSNNVTTDTANRSNNNVNVDTKDTLKSPTVVLSNKGKSIPILSSTLNPPNTN